MTATLPVDAPRLFLFTYRYLHPSYAEYLTLDSAAPDREAALQSARRFIRRENTRFRRAKVPRRLRLPLLHDLRKEG